LDQAEHCFFETLCVDPSDPSALNGVGSILMFERELAAAEFFQLRAIAMVKREGGDYPAAQHDPDLILFYKRPKAGQRMNRLLICCHRALHFPGRSNR